MEIHVNTSDSCLVELVPMGRAKLKGTSWDITIKYRTINKESCIEEFKLSSLFDSSTIEEDAHETSEVEEYKEWLELYSEKYRNYLLEKKKKIPLSMETQSDCVEEEVVPHETNKIVDLNKEHIENASYSQTVIEETEYKSIEVTMPNNNPNYSEQFNEILNIITDICDNGNNERRDYPYEIEQLWKEYAATLHIKKWLLNKFGYKELIREFDELGYSISKDTLYRFYKRRTIPIRINRNAIMAWVLREKRIISAWMDWYKVFRQQASP